MHEAALPTSCRSPLRRVSKKSLTSSHGLRNALLSLGTGVMAPVWCYARLFLTSFIRVPTLDMLLPFHDLVCLYNSLLQQVESRFVQPALLTSRSSLLDALFLRPLLLVSLLDVSRKPSSCLKASILPESVRFDICALSFSSSWSAGLTLQHVGDS